MKERMMGHVEQAARMGEGCVTRRNLFQKSEEKRQFVREVDDREMLKWII
jgi:DhnA family fructose-bisphosphate aldolase class Ia